MRAPMAYRESQCVSAAGHGATRLTPRRHRDEP